MKQSFKTNAGVVVKGIPLTRGYSCLKKFRDGVKITQRQSILANCCLCMGFYVDGKKDCEIDDCPLYPFFPYKNKEEVQNA